MPHVIFPTALGTCAIAWDGELVTRFHLPESSEGLTRERAGRGGSEEVAEDQAPPGIRSLIGKVRRHLSGSSQDFSDAPLDWSLVSAFQAGVYRQTLKIRPGTEGTYGQVALEMGLDVIPPLRAA